MEDFRLELDPSHCSFSKALPSSSPAAEPDGEGQGPSRAPSEKKARHDPLLPSAQPKAPPSPYRNILPVFLHFVASSLISTVVQNVILLMACDDWHAENGAAKPKGAFSISYAGLPERDACSFVPGHLISW
ncbi:hypothetical protein BDK51DRAFT_39922 [Blyttiomyces helicus]|uniref:Uncharacterized protein n=1 Tax=Blyttiomyces helicus TaxID=388810 RepID=A0A4P9W911_9FUNG|nr:hypothetical protein BDK51DRAFT_39922 [Blyttiomyces helicus]|eukprot:RKO88874.1 hypothetical protein BDK51DRAFT_39922 [Blyttiomyces helicus]